MSVNKKSYNRDLKPYLVLPPIPVIEVAIYLPKKVNVLEYVAIADGEQRVFKDFDAIPSLLNNKIHDPSDVSYINLFINGVLQPQQSYSVEEGALYIHTEDVPIKGSPVVLQMIKV